MATSASFSTLIPIVIVVVVVLMVVLAVAGWRERANSLKKVDLSDGGIAFSTAITESVLRYLRRIDPAVPKLSFFVETFLKRHYLVWVADAESITVWRSGREPLQVIRVLPSWLKKAERVQGIAGGPHLDLTFVDPNGSLMVITMIPVAYRGSKVGGGDVMTRVARSLTALISGSP
ncbi:MAG: hypothetical protein ABIR17_08725 [Pseudolysinimonas sp.]|uniref:hypothetical protein n=1 Tax=Pseudolysinimonas sp. TaxID=2680009 RepID=UPI00326313AA